MEIKLSWTKTVTDCDQYFLPNNHLKAYSYRKYTEDEKTAAFTQAVRELQVSQGRAMEDPDDDDTYRDDYAVYEQTMYLLDNTSRQLEGGVPNVINLTSSEDKQEVNRVGVLIAPEALRYFAISRIKMVRG